MAPPQMPFPPMPPPPPGWGMPDQTQPQDPSILGGPPMAHGPYVPPPGATMLGALVPQGPRSFADISAKAPAVPAPVDPTTIRRAQPGAAPRLGGPTPQLAPLDPRVAAFDSSTAAYRRFVEMQMQRELQKRPGYIAPTPEREQRTGFQTHQEKGPAPEIEMSRREVVLGRENQVDANAIPNTGITGEHVAALFEPPPGVKDAKAWANAEAERMRRERITVADEVARGALGDGPLKLREISAGPLPKGLVKKTGEEIDAWERAEVERKTAAQQGLIEALDAKAVATVGRHVEAVAADDKAQADFAAKYGEGGLVGSARRQGEIAAGIADERAKALGDIARQEDFKAAELREVEERAKPKLDKIRAEIDGVRAEMAKGVDQGRFWNSRDTGQQIGLSIAVMLGAIGAAKAGGANIATQQLEKAIDRDIEEQRRAIGEGAERKLSALQRVYVNVKEETGDERAATLAMRNAASENIKSRMAVYEARAQGSVERERAKAMLADETRKQLERDAEISARVRGNIGTNWRVDAARAGGYGGGPDERKIAGYMRDLMGTAEKGLDVGIRVSDANAKATEAQAKGPKIERVVVGGKTYELTNATSSGEGAEQRKKMAALDSMDGLLKQIETAAGSYGQRAWDSKKLDNLVERYVYAMSKAEEQGIVKEPEMERAVKNLAGYKGSKSVIDDLQRYHNAQRENNLRQLGAVETAPARR